MTPGPSVLPCEFRRSGSREPWATIKELLSRKFRCLVCGAHHFHHVDFGRAIKKRPLLPAAVFNLD